MSSLFDQYKVRLVFQRGLLATNPCDPNIMDTHILDKQRKLIMEKGGVNAAINKYLDQIQISAQKGEAEVGKIVDRLEDMLGYKLSEEERRDAITGKLASLRQTFQEMDTKGTTVFFWDRETDRPAIGDHMILGFLKASAEAIGRTLDTKKGEVLHSISYTQSLINQHVRVATQFIPLDRDIVRNSDGTPKYLQRSLRAMTAQGPRVSLAKSEQVAAGASCAFTLRVMKNSAITEDILRRFFEYGELSGLGQWRNAGNGQFTFELASLQ